MTPVNSTADESAWREFDLQAFWEGLNGIEAKSVSNVTEEPLTSEILSEGCDHTWVSADGRVSDFRSYLLYTASVATPYKFCPMCGEKL